jgi:hypothetical protein
MVLLAKSGKTGGLRDWDLLFLQWDNDSEAMWDFFL